MSIFRKEFGSKNVVMPVYLFGFVCYGAMALGSSLAPVWRKYLGFKQALIVTGFIKLGMIVIWFFLSTLGFNLGCLLIFVFWSIAEGHGPLTMTQLMGQCESTDDASEVTGVGRTADAFFGSIGAFVIGNFVFPAYLSAGGEDGPMPWLVPLTMWL